MNKIETEFDKLKRYEDIETYYPPLEDIKDFLYELFGDRVESQKYIVRANKQIDQLTNNWNELEEWIKDNLGNCRTNIRYEKGNEYIIKENAYYKVLSKMKEIQKGSVDND